MRNRNNLMIALMVGLLATLAVGYVGGLPLESRAHAAARPPKAPANAVAQRQKMIVALDEVSKNIKASMELQRQLVRLLEGGNAKIEVTNLDEIKIRVADKPRG